MTAISKRERFCWKDRLRSVVTKTSNSACAFPSRTPFLSPPHPIRAADLTSHPASSRPSRQSMHSSRSTLRGDKEFLPCFFQDGNHLVPFDGGEPLQEIINRVPGFEVIEKRLDRHPCSFEHGRSTHDPRVNADLIAFHTGQYTPLDYLLSTFGSRGRVSRVRFQDRHIS